MSVRAPSEKNFRRARVSPGKRKRPRLRVTWRGVRHVIAIALAAYVAYCALDLVASASPLQVSHVLVHGNVRLSNGEVEALLRSMYGRNILTIDLSRYRRRLLESPWVAEVALRRVLPSTVEVFVSERRPTGICRLGAQLYLIDRRGTVIDEFGPQYAEFDLPIVDGLVRAPRDGHPAIDEGRAELAARVIESVSSKKDLKGRVSQIDVSDPHNAVVLLDNDPALLQVGEDRFAERLHSYLEVASALRDRVEDIDYVDLRFGDRVYVRPKTGTRGAASRRTVRAKTY